MPWYTGKTGCGCCGSEEPVDPDGCERCANGTPDQLKITVSGLADRPQCPFQSQANGVYILERDDAGCSWVLCVEYPKDEDGFSLGPCFFELESITISVFIGFNQEIFLNFRHYNGDDECNIGIGINTDQVVFEDTVHLPSINDDCNLIDTQYNPGTLQLSAGSGFGSILWGTGTIRIEAI